LKNFIPYGQQWIDEDDIESVVSVLKSDWLTTGPKVAEFEKEFASYVNSKYAVAVSSGTAALHAAAYAAGISNGDEVITTAMTFAATANCVLYQNGKPVFADIDKKTYNIDHVEIEKNITNKTKAIIPVDYTGQPCDLDKINEIAEKYDLVVIEDASHAVGSTYKEKKVGSISDLSVFSFHPVKHITTGEGGMITTDSKEMYEKLLLFRNHGITKNQHDFVSSNDGGWFYEQQLLGYNYRISDFQCALGISQLKKIDAFIKRRKEIVKKYNESFEEFDKIITPFQLKYIESSWHLYVVQLNLEKLKVSRKKIFNELFKNNIGIQVHYIPVYYHPHYQRLGYKKGLCPNAEWLYERIITLPLYPKMTDDDVNIVIKAVKKVID
jgi:UDP-4-amino-4,6-dideoxy-N-acetyl-beta-L-altrosamine transaminase